MRRRWKLNRDEETGTSLICTGLRLAIAELLSGQNTIIAYVIYIATCRVAIPAVTKANIKLAIAAAF
jgi:hypothetical protein